MKPTKNNLRQNAGGGANGITETKNESTENECENTTNEKKWKRSCPKCGKTLVYTYQTGFIYAKKHNTSCIFCSKSRYNEITSYEKRCPGCGRKIYYKTKRGLEKSIKSKSKCRKCTSKDFPSPMKYLDYKFSKQHKEKIGKKSTERQVGKKHPVQRIKNMISGLVKMPYEKWIEVCPKETRYRKRIHYLSRKKCKEVGMLHFGCNGYNMDHVFPVKEGFRLGIPEKVMSDISNLRMIKTTENKRKSAKITEIPEIIKPYYETDSKS